MGNPSLLNVCGRYKVIFALPSQARNECMVVEGEGVSEGKRGSKLEKIEMKANIDVAFLGSACR